MEKLYGKDAQQFLLEQLTAAQNGLAEALARYECSGQPIPDTTLRFSSATAGLERAKSRG